jgi:hypothetical protein
MYRWVNQHLRLGFPEPIVEDDFKPLSIAEMSVWDEKHPKPKSGDDYERSLLKWITSDSERQMEALVPRDGASLAEYRRVVGGALEAMIGRGVPPKGAVRADVRQQQELGSCRLTKMLLRYEAKGEEVPAILFEPKVATREVVILVDPCGKQALLDSSGAPREDVAKLLAGGSAVLGIDLFGQGEFTPDGKPLAKARLLTASNWNRYLGYTLGYNRPLFAQRVHDILSAISCLKATRPSEQKLRLVALKGAGHWAAAARAVAGSMVDEATIDTGGFRFAKIGALDDADMLPGGAKYLDLPGILALSAPCPLELRGEGETAPPVVAAAYRAAGRPENLVTQNRVSK